MNISVVHNFPAPSIKATQIAHCLGKLKIPRNLYEPIGGTVPSIFAKTRADYDFIINRYPE